MRCGGNTIARSLALVAIATGAAFVHWGLDPIPTLASPKGIPDEPVGGSEAAPPGDTDDGGEQTPDGAVAPPGTEGDTGAETPTDPPEPVAGGADAEFDPTALDLEIGTDDAYQLWQMGTVVFIDARPPEEYEAGHIPAAFLVPPSSLDAGRLIDLIDPAIGGVDPSQRVVVYCEGGTCDASELVAYDLQDMGFTRVHIYVDGFPAWQGAGYDVVTGPDPVLGELP